MISEGRIIQIVLLMERAKHQLNQAIDAEEAATSEWHMLETKKVLGKAIESAGKLDQPVEDSEEGIS